MGGRRPAAEADGTRLWEYRTEATGPLPELHEKHNLATPTPATDGQRVFAWFGNGQIVALDCWRSTRAQASSDGRPLVVPGPQGDELFVNSSERIDVYDPTTGTLLWYAGNPRQTPIPSAVFHDGRIYLSRGYRNSDYMAIRPGGRGDVTATHIEWQAPSGASYVPSIVYYAPLTTSRASAAHESTPRMERRSQQARRPLRTRRGHARDTFRAPASPLECSRLTRS